MNVPFYILGFFDHFFTPDIFLGFTAMSIFTVTALISNKSSMVFLGPKLWKRILQFGYLAYGLLVIRGAILDYSLWISFLSGEMFFLTVRMLLTALGTIVLLFRFSALIHSCFKK
jgi:DMSO/TMAO reductase YedYZ heme-binding membrane subunit